MPHNKFSDDQVKAESFVDLCVVRLTKDELLGKPPRHVIPIGNVEFIMEIDCDVCPSRGEFKGTVLNPETLKRSRCTLCGGKGKTEMYLPAFKVIDAFKQLRRMAKRVSEDLKIKMTDGKDGYHVRKV